MHGRGSGRAGNVSISVSRTHGGVSVTVVSRAWVVEVSESLKPAAIIVRAESFFYDWSWKITVTQLAHTAWEVAGPEFGENVVRRPVAIVRDAFWLDRPQTIELIVERKAMGAQSVATESLLPVCKSS